MPIPCKDSSRRTTSQTKNKESIKALSKRRNKVDILSRSSPFPKQTQSPALSADYI